MNKWLRISLLCLIDSLLIIASVYGAYLLRFDFEIRQHYANALPYVLLMYVLLMIPSFWFYKIYKRIWVYASIGDLISIGKGTITASAAFYFFHQAIVLEYEPDIVVPRSIYLLTIIMAFLSISGSRFIWRIFRDNYIKIKPHHQRALVIGAGEAGIMVVRELKHTVSEYYPVAFIDDNADKIGMEVNGVPVVGTRIDIPNVVVKDKIDIIILAIPAASRLEIASILNICKQTGCQIKIVPRVNDLINGNISIKMIRDVSVEDLLGRDPVNVDLEAISEYVRDQVILISGAGGSIGSELCRQIAGFKPRQILLLGRGENSIYDIELELRSAYPRIQIEPLIADIQNKKRIQALFSKYKPQVVFHAAAHKHVPLMEKNPLEAVRNNIIGTKNIAECAHENNTSRFVMISTDKAVNPTSIMGASKRAAELVVQGFNQISNTRFAAVRFGNVLGSRGSVIPVFKRQIEEGGPVTVTHPEMIRYFMTIPEAVQLVIQAGAIADGGEIFILDMGQPVKIADLARDLIRLSGLEPEEDIKIIYSGIRPGEKLFEEILTSEEGTAATKNDRIYIARPSCVSYADVKAMVTSFEQMILIENHHLTLEEVRDEITRWIPQYHKPNYMENESKESINQAMKASFEVIAALENK